MRFIVAALIALIASARGWVAGWGVQTITGKYPVITALAASVLAETTSASRGVNQMPAWLRNALGWTALIVVFAVLCETSDYYLGRIWTNAILLAAIVIFWPAMAWYFKRRARRPT